MDDIFEGNLSVGFITYLKTVIFTNFESVDGWTSPNGNGGLSAGLANALFSPDVLNNNPWEVFRGGNTATFNFSRNPLFQITVAVEANDDSIVYIGPGEPTGAGGENIQFKFDGLDLYAENYDESSVTSTFIQTLNADQRYQLRAVFTSGSKIEFYVDNVLVATHTTNLPTLGFDSGVSLFGDLGVGDEPIFHLSSLLYVEDLP